MQPSAPLRADAGQFFTPPPVVRLMASFFETLPADIHLLDAGAGVGVLTAAFVNGTQIHADDADKML
ncbi:MAG: hypothetical protein D8M54_18535 [Chloroflexi bacterium]|nr:hypothetical protein [Chloroflexota bacterium]